ncbi:FadR/GntR family transcriptional regulator [Pseudolysinimonas yzui]|uniref:FadR/GntR family transcriptional regulator n=1 Tax=Pseudolysinimonas yzui TaxID=2708254 RepID=UPI00174814B7|nr:FCD domain-containing protein [Pseudolysinimonas yzui]
MLNELGSAILSGEMDEGHRETVDSLVWKTGASRSVVREATRVLVSLGLLKAGRRVGLRVLGHHEWNTLHPRVVRWRLASPDRARQLSELRDLRHAVEPEAARLAALRRGDGQVTALLRATAELGDARDDPERFLHADRKVHGLVLASSGNLMFARLQGVVDEALRDRAFGPNAVAEVAHHDLTLHYLLVEAIKDQDAPRAHATSREIVERAFLD